MKRFEHTHAGRARSRSWPQLALGACLLGLAHGAPCAGAPVAATLQQLTQALADAIAPGERTLWERYTDPQLMYVTEDNEVKNRAQLLADLKPLPAGSSGHIVVEQFRCVDHGALAVTTYLMNEHETVEGHELHALYRGSDTWHRHQGGWLLVASQVYAIPQDPPRTPLQPEQLHEYVGRYLLSAATAQTIRGEGDHLVAERPGRPAQTLYRESGDVFFTPGRPRTRRIFRRTAAGQIAGFAERREGTDLAWTRAAPE